MTGSLWQGLPRTEIPWFPTVDYEKCVGCRTCYETCPHGVYTLDESRNRPLVAHPYECVVFCEACAKMCPQGAISFPPRQEIADLIRTMRERNEGPTR